MRWLVLSLGVVHDDHCLDIACFFCLFFLVDGPGSLWEELRMMLYVGWRCLCL